MKVNQKIAEEALREFLTKDCEDHEDVMYRASYYLVGALKNDKTILQDLNDAILVYFLKERVEIE